MAPFPGRHARGLTLVELLLVLFIIGLGWFALLPRLDLAGGRDLTGGRFPELNKLLGEARRTAATEGLPQLVRGESGGDRLTWTPRTEAALRMPPGNASGGQLGAFRRTEEKEREVRLPGPAMSVKINGKSPQERAFTFRVYPSGVMDLVELGLPSGEAMLSQPLTCRFDMAEELLAAGTGK